MATNADCMACRANRGDLHAPGGVIWDDGRWRVEHMLAPAVLAGWLIVKTVRHVESLADLDAGEAAALGPLLARVTAALEAETGVERVYASLFAEAVRHVHFHLVPRRASVPEPARGPAVFTLPPTATETACAALARRIGDRLREHREVAV